MTSQPPSHRPASQPFQAFTILGALALGWLAARLPATLETHSRLAAITSPTTSPPAPTPAQTPAQTSAIQLQPIYIQVPTPTPAPAPAPQIIHIHHYGPAPEGQPQPQFSYALPPQSSPSPPPTPLPTPASPAAPPPPDPTAGLLAAAAYEKLAQNNKREALRLFEAALAADNPAAPDPRQPQWQQQARALKRRWSGQAFALLRESPADPATGLLTGPLLGGSQSGAALGYTPNPLARRPITLSARLNAATDATGRTDPRSAQAALGVRYELLPALSLTAERLIAVGDDARDDWLLRLSGGTSQRLRLLGRPLALDAYGEASLLGNGDSLAAGQARALAPLLSSRNLSLSAGLGSWASLQNTGPATIGRLDVGPSAAVRLGQGRLALELSADYRQRIAGQALPGSGPALTLGTSF